MVVDCKFSSRQFGFDFAKRSDFLALSFSLSLTDSGEPISEAKSGKRSNIITVK